MLLKSFNLNFMLTKLKRYLSTNLSLIYGGPLTLDGWRWISSKLPKTADNLTLLDIGCGSGYLMKIFFQEKMKQLRQP